MHPLGDRPLGEWTGCLSRCSLLNLILVRRPYCRGSVAEDARFKKVEAPRAAAAKLGVTLAGRATGFIFSARVRDALTRVSLVYSLVNKHAAAELGVSEVTARLGLEKGPGSPKLKLRRSNNPTEYLSTFRLRPPRIAYVLSPDMGSLLRRANDRVVASKLNRGMLPAESGR